MKYQFKVSFTLLKSKYYEGEDYQEPQALTWADWEKWGDKFRDYIKNDMELGQYIPIYDTVVEEEVYVYQDEATGKLIASVIVFGDALPAWANNERVTKRSLRRHLEYILDSYAWCDGDPTLEEWDEEVSGPEGPESMHGGWAMWFDWDRKIEWHEFEPPMPQPSQEDLERYVHTAEHSSLVGDTSNLISGLKSQIGRQVNALAAGDPKRRAYIANRLVKALKDKYEADLYEHEVNY